MGLVGWQAAFMAVGIPGLLLAILVFTLKEPVRGLIDGIPTPPAERPFSGFREELLAIIPPFTLWSAAQRGSMALLINVSAGLLAVLVAYLLGTATGSYLQWACVAFGYYAVFSWASSLRSRDAATFQLIWASPAFLATVLGYGMVAFINYATAAFAAVYAQEVLGISASQTGLWIGGSAALSGFLGVILGGRLSDALLKRFATGRLFVIAFGLIAPLPFVAMAFTLSPSADGNSLWLFTFYSAMGSLLASSALGAAAATTQDLVLPRMRGTATATFFIGTTLVGLALGPYMAGYISASTASLSTGVMSTFIAVPIGVIALWVAFRQLPRATANIAGHVAAEKRHG
jgi:hypothetical protein